MKYNVACFRSKEVLSHQPHLVAWLRRQTHLDPYELGALGLTRTADTRFPKLLLFVQHGPRSGRKPQYLHLGSTSHGLLRSREDRAGNVLSQIILPAVVADVGRHILENDRDIPSLQDHSHLARMGLPMLADDALHHRDNRSSVLSIAGDKPDG